MANIRITALPAITSISGDDLLIAVDDPGGTPATSKITVTNFLTNLPPSAEINTISGSIALSPSVATSFATLRGGPANATGSYIVVYGTSHATQAGNAAIVANTAGGAGNIQFLIYDGVSTWTTVMTVTRLFNVGIGVATAGTGAVKCLVLSNNATAPSTSADRAHLYAADVSAGNAVLAIWQEMAPYAGAGVASTHKIPMIWNGVTYYVLATTVA